jgi:hypothetical protein
VIADINVGVLYVFAISLGVYGIIMAGGRQFEISVPSPRCARPRRWCRMKSHRLRHYYGPSYARAAQALGHCRGAERPYGMFGWYWLPLLPMFVVFFVSALAETNAVRSGGSGVRAGRGLHGRIRLDTVYAFCSANMLPSAHVRHGTILFLAAGCRRSRLRRSPGYRASSGSRLGLLCSFCSPWQGHRAALMA